MNSEPEHADNAVPDPLEESELARRLRRMEWPAAPQDVKDRVLERVLEEASDQGLGLRPANGNPSKRAN